MSLPARVLSCFLVIVFLFAGVCAPLTHAQFDPQNPYGSLIKTDPSIPVNIGILTQGVVMGLLSTATCIVGGVDFATPNHRCIDYNSQTGTYGYAPQSNQGILGLATGGIALAFSSPVHTSDYFRYLSQNFGIVKSANAAPSGYGIGFNQLSPITNLWVAFRNLSYLIFVIIFVVIGFAVMLRAKIDPRTVMTIENQIPKLVVALILITFSYAIAGFVIDVMWVGVYLVINIFASLDPAIAKQVGTITTQVQVNPLFWVSTLNTNWGGTSGAFGWLGIAGQAAGGVKDTASAVTIDILDQAPFLKIFFLLFSLPGWIIAIVCAIKGAIYLIPFVGGAVGQDFGQCVDQGFGTFIGGIIGAVAFLIFGIALAVALIKVWWHLIKAYALFIIFTIFGPLAIMSGVIPGWTKTNFEYWIRHLLAYTIVFPTVMGVFLLGKTLMDVYQPAAATTPPLLGVSGNALAFMGPLLGFAVMMLAPQSLAMVQDALNAPDPKYLASIGAGIGVGSAAFGSGIGKLWDRSWRESDPLRGLDEGWARKFLMPRGSRRREIFYGKETNTGIKPNP